MLSAGFRLGPYTILAPLGAGGMGEVYRARDPRLGREVAVKVLPAEAGGDASRLRRFEQEARAASALSHPSILTVFDTGSQDGAPYLVTELLEGMTLRDRLAGGPLPARKAVEIAIQVARGLAAAHDKGIVHRDIKPDNLFLTRDGRVKILDFGLARLQEPLELALAPTILTNTRPGAVLGTIGYMAPEQVRGQPADHRSDLFALGAVLYEMLAGHRAFRRESSAETMAAILHEEPPALTVSPALERVVRHCLEKDPQHRFQSAGDLAFGLESLSALSGIQMPSVAVERRRGLPLRIAAAAVLLLALAFLAGGLAHREWGQGEPPRFRRLTFRRGIVGNARFAPDGQTIVYSAAWDGKPDEIFTTRTDNTESRSLGLAPAVLHSISSQGEMLVALVQERNAGQFFTLAQLALAGGAPRPILEGSSLRWADWGSGGESLAILTFDSAPRIEYPRGKVIRRLEGFAWDLRVSPDGDELAFCELRGGIEQTVVILDRAGKTVAESGGWSKPTPTLDPRGCVAWAPGGREVWFAASRPGGESGLYALGRGGEVRPLLHIPGNLALLDVARDGRVLLTQFTPRSSIMASAPGDSEERDLSWFGSSELADLSTDGRRVLFTEYAQGGSDRTSVYLRGTDGTPAVRLGDGWALALSPDGRWALARDLSDRRRLFLLPTGAGEPRALPPAPLEVYGARWPAGKQILLFGYEPGTGFRLYVREVDAKEARPLAPPGIRLFVPSPDGSRVAAWRNAAAVRIYPVGGGEPHTVPHSQGGWILQWRADGRALYMERGLNDRGGWIDEIDIITGKRVPWKELRLSDAAGALVADTQITPDGRAHARTVTRSLSTLYLAEGLR